MSQFDPSIDDTSDDNRGAAFLVVSHDGQHTLVEMGETGEIIIGSDPSADCRLTLPGVAPRHCTIRWAGAKLVVIPTPGAKTHRGGRPVEETMRLDPGDDLVIGPVEIIVGVRVTTDHRRKRTLTHAELRERVVEEIARADRVGRRVGLISMRCSFGQGAKLARSTTEVLRAGDVLGSHGPDEIEVMLADAEDAAVASVVDRIVARCGFQVTAGYAIAPEDADDADGLFAASHRALDEALADGATLGRSREVPILGHEPLTLDDISRELAERVRAFATAEQPVILVGERGAGRATLARWMHSAAGRPDDKFMALAPRHARDARSISVRVKSAQGGTLVIRDVDDWPLDGQLLLREALASARNVRIVTTTTRTLGPLVERGVIDSMLFRILDGNRIEVPALRNRPTDLVSFAEHFARENGGVAQIRFSVGAFARLYAYPWPGNLVELGDAMRRAAQLAGQGEILAEHLPSEPVPADSAAGRLREHVDSVERDAIIRSLADCNQNQTHAARQLGLSRRALIYKMEKYGLKPPAGTAPRRSSTPARRTSKPVRVA